MVKKYIIFDWDGCLAKTLELIVSAYQKAFAKYGKQPSTEGIARKAFGQLRGILDLGISEPEMDDFYAEYWSALHGQYASTPLYPGAKEVLEKLSNDRNVFLVTMSRKDMVTNALAHHGLARYFTEVISGDDVEKHKPDPESINSILSRHNAKPSEAVIIGDSKSDLGAAQNAGIDSVLFFPDSHNIFYDKAKLIREYRPTWVISDLKELPTLLQN